MEINAKAASTHVFPVMDQFPNGDVHSVFNNSFNLMFGNRLIHIGAIEQGLSPFGIAVQGSKAADITACIRHEKNAVWNAEQGVLLIGKSAVIHTVQAEKHDLALSSDEVPDLNRLNKYAKRCARHLQQNGFKAGLLDTLEEQAILLDYLIEDKTGSISFLKQLEELEQLAKGRLQITPEIVYDYWIGRGPGLTPSGDDMLTGLLASLEMQGLLSLELRASLKEYLDRQGLKRTTQVAYEYLLYALRGFFHGSIQELCMAFASLDEGRFNQALIEMERVGHTSGIDTILGMLIGIKAGR